MSWLPRFFLAVDQPPLAVGVRFPLCPPTRICDDGPFKRGPSFVQVKVEGTLRNFASDRRDGAEGHEKPERGEDADVAKYEGIGESVSLDHH